MKVDKDLVISIIHKTMKKIIEANTRVTAGNKHMGDDLCSKQLMDMESHLFDILSLVEIAICSEVEKLHVLSTYSVKHGEWELVDTTEPMRYGCSECNRLSFTQDNYCPYCGAKMK